MKFTNFQIEKEEHYFCSNEVLMDTVVNLLLPGLIACLLIHVFDDLTVRTTYILEIMEAANGLKVHFYFNHSPKCIIILNHIYKPLHNI